MRFAARMDPRLTRILRRMRLDGPVAEAARELRAYAELLEIPSPSYACLRLHIADERTRRAERDAALEVAAAFTLTRSVVPTIEGIETEYRKAVARRLTRRRR